MYSIPTSNHNDTCQHQNQYTAVALFNFQTATLITTFHPA
jgi:hypothetical protein